ncbi:MAG: ABC transporter ATP-binding protein [Candidatus Methanomethylophilaceae archaeon]|nr:ABC transporter ATP-binding protein [Candidatus Methanomethylophilaceae archaeon]
MTEVEISDLSFGYTKDSLILKDICLSLKGPQLVSVIGPNGVGKSTLIHCIDNILSPTGGQVSVDGVPVTEYRPKDFAKKVGYVPYTSGDSFPMTVVDTVLMGRNPHHKWKSLHDDMVVVEEAMRMMDVSDLAMRQFNELSAGQHQRVMLARGIAQEPEILLLDEPTANLDIRHQMDVIRLLKTLSVEKGIMVIMISHDLNLAAKYSDNIVMMSEGTIYAAGTPEEVITAGNIKHVYDVDSEVIVKEGRPFMVPQDPEFAAGEATGVLYVPVHRWRARHGRSVSCRGPGGAVREVHPP